MAAKDGLKAQKLLAQGVLDVTYDTPSFKTLWGTSDGIAGDGGAKGLRLFLPFYFFTFLPLKAFLP